MNLKSTVTTGAPGRRPVEFILGALGQILRRPDGDAKSPTLFELTLQYIPRKELRRITEESTYRRIGNAAKGTKEEVTDEEMAGVELCQKAIKGWKMTVAAMRALHFEHDMSGHEDDEAVDFSAENLELAVRYGDLHNVVYMNLNDYEFWFPDRRTREKNSQSGPSGSSVGSPVAPA